MARDRDCPLRLPQRSRGSHGPPSKRGARDPGHDAGTAAAAADAGQDEDPYQAALHIYGHEEACVACVARECEKEARACADDDACTEDARCRSRCDDDPNCQYWNCADRYPLEMRPTGPLEEGCIQSKCLDACRVGHAFDCVGKYPPIRPEGASAPVVSTQLVGGAALTPFREAELRGRACAFADIECAEPMARAVRSDASGALSIPFPPPAQYAFRLRGFQGYLELTDPEEAPPRTLPVLWIPFIEDGLPAAPPRSNHPPWPLTAMPSSTVQLLDTIAGIRLTPGRGGVGGAVFDCRWSQSWRATGVTIEIVEADAQTQVLYGTSQSATATDRSGFANAFNVPTGIVTLKAFYSKTEIARVDVPVRAGAMTEVYLSPAGAK